MMSKQLEEARKVLDAYIEAMHLRHTSEREAILCSIFSFEGHFTVEELQEVLEQRRFVVSRATVYNTLRLFLRLNLIVRHRLMGKTTYEVASRADNHCHQICTICGKVTEVKIPAVEEAMKKVVLRRFRKEEFALYVYGICSSCAAKITRAQRQIDKTVEQKNM